MIDAQEIITCKSYQPICDYMYDYPNLDDVPPTGLVHVPLDHIEEFFKRIDSNGHRYVVVSSCSDYGLALQGQHPAWMDMIKWVQMQTGPSLGYNGISMEARLDPSKCNIRHPFSVKCHSWTRATLPSIPDNVHHWFVTNLMIFPHPDIDELVRCNLHEKITAIPFGVAENKSEELAQAMSKKLPQKDRLNKIYVSWNDYTHDRYKLRREMMEWQSYAGNDALTVRLPGDGQDTYEDYLENLSKHKYVLSPPGNGEDCYRTLESIYMGCITLVKDTVTNYLTGLPVYKYGGMDDIIAYYNSHQERTEEIEYKEQVKLSYWKNMIHGKRSELF